MSAKYKTVKTDIGHSRVMWTVDYYGCTGFFSLDEEAFRTRSEARKACREYNDYTREHSNFGLHAKVAKIVVDSH